MLSAIDFDDQLCLGTEEISYIGTDRMLPEKPKAIQLLATQPRPKTQFRVGRILS